MVSMTQSTEYPDLVFVPPKAFGTGRDGKAVRYIVIHYTAGSEGPTSAENGATNDQRRTDGVSTHYFVDSNSVVQCVLTRDRANAARHKGNRLGIQYELCGTAQTRAQWLDAASNPTLTNAARQIARDCQKYGIPVRRLTVAQTRADWFNFPTAVKGIVGHVDCTNAYPEDGGDHQDPGTAFPWDVLFARINDFMSIEEDDLTPEQARDAAMLGGYDLLQMAAQATDADSTNDTPTARQVKTFINTIIAARLGPLEEKLDRIEAAIVLLTPPTV
jgi:N-acetyl-anhydromuramyl-L-alanine amidase AmpD